MIAFRQLSAFRRAAGIVVPALCALSATSRVRAEKAETNACVSAYEAAQEQRKHGKLRAAHEQLSLCTSSTCPDFVRADCSQWLGEVEEATPSVVVEARDTKGAETTGVKVFFDGELVASELDGTAISVDPGKHTFRFEQEGADAVEQSLVVKQGEKNRRLSVRFQPPTARTTLEGAEPRDEPAPRDEGGLLSRLTPPMWALAGVGAVGLGAFALFAATGKSDENELRDGCKPFCAQSEIDAVNRKYLFADLSLAVGLVSLGVGTYLYLTSAPPAENPAPRRGQGPRALRFGVDVEPHGGWAAVAGSF